MSTISTTARSNFSQIRCHIVAEACPALIKAALETHDVVSELRVWPKYSISRVPGPYVLLSSADSWCFAVCCDTHPIRGEPHVRTPYDIVEILNA